MALTVTSCIPGVGGPSLGNQIIWTPSCFAGLTVATDVLADTEELAAFMNVKGGGCFISSLFLSNTIDEAPELDILFLKSNVSIGTEGDAVALTNDTTILEMIGKINVPSTAWEDVGGARIAQLTTSDFGMLELQATAATRSLWAAILVQSAVNPTASSLQLTFNTRFK